MNLFYYIIYKALIIFTFISLLNSCTDGSISENSSPSINGAIQFKNLRVGESLNFLPTANDPDGDVLTFSISGMPVWASFNSSSGLLSGIPLAEDLGSTAAITITVSDGEFNASIGPFNLTVTDPIFFISIGVDTIDTYRNMDFELSGCFISNDDPECLEGDELLTIDENGIFSFEGGLETGSSFELKVDRDPGRQECILEIEEGVIGSEDQTIAVSCQPDASAALFTLDKMHKIRLTMSIDEWNRFVLDTERSTHLNETANGNYSFTNWTHSEIYRQVDFEYLDAEGNTLERHDKVGFKMKGNTSRQWPESIKEEDGILRMTPRRFSFGIKFDEEFDEDEGVYSCIDSTGVPAAVAGHPCYGRVGKDLEEVPENDGREFMDLEKISFRFNTNDPSYQRELLAHDILNSIGVPASRVAHANIELNIIGDGYFYGKPLPQSFNMGVFQMVEQVDKPFLKRYFGKNGFLFKIGPKGDLAGNEEINFNCIPYENSEEFYNLDFCQIGIEKFDPESREEWLGSNNYLNPSFVNSDINDGGEVSQFRPYKPKYDLKSKKKSIAEGRILLQDFINFVQTYPSAAVLADQFDIQGFIKAQAAEVVIGAVDKYARAGANYYLYLNPISRKWVYIPNDFDFVFRDSHSLEVGSPSWFSAFRDIVETYALEHEDKIHWTGRSHGGEINPILWDIIFSEKVNQDLLYQNIGFILENYFIYDKLETKLMRRDDLIREAVLATEAAMPEGFRSVAYGDCGFIYNPLSIYSEENDLCDSSDISIKKFIELRKLILYEELQINGL